MELDEMCMKLWFLGFFFVIELQLNPYSILINKILLQGIMNFFQKALQ